MKFNNLREAVKYALENPLPDNVPIESENDDGQFTYLNTAYLLIMMEKKAIENGKGMRICEYPDGQLGVQFYDKAT